MWFMPWHFAQWVRWLVDWLIKYNIRKQPYELKDQEYLTRSILHYSKRKWDLLDPKDRKKIMALELWQSENEQKWRERQRKAMLAARAADSDIDLPE